MGWGKRESTCRRCWQVGHTRRNCPSNPDYIKQDYAARAKNRACNYCMEVGHNRSSCVKRKDALAKFKKDELLRRRAINTFYKKNGIAIGAVMSYIVPTWVSKSREQVINVLTLKEHCAVRATSDVYFKFHNTIENDNIHCSVATLGMIAEWGHVNIPWVDSNGNNHTFSFYPDYKVEVLIPASESATLIPDNELTDESTVIDIPSNLADTVRKKKND